MHGFAIAESIIRTALMEAEKHQGKSISVLCIKLGKSDHFEPESLELCLKAAAKGTIAENAKIEITPLEPMVRCRKCGNKFTLQSQESVCPGCRDGKLEVLTDSEVLLDSIELD